jgi:outer membrane protein assembly factor BamB
VSESAQYLTPSWKITVVVFLCIVADAVADPPSVTAPSISQPPAAKKETESLRQGGHNSITLTHQQSGIQCMELIRAAIARQDYLAAKPLMEQVLSEPDSFVSIDASTEVGAHEEVRRLIRLLPDDLRRQMAESQRVSARIAWDLARSQGATEVTAFLRNYSDGPLGIDAWWWLGCHERDHACRLTAAAAFARVAEHPLATVSQRIVAMMAEYEALNVAGRAEEAARLRVRLAGSDLQRTVAIRGQSFTLGQWLDEHQINSSDQSPTYSVRSLDQSQVLAQRPVTEPIWKKKFDSPLDASLDARELKQREQGVRPISLLRPLIVDQLVIVRTLESIQAFDLTNGDIRWTIRNTENRQPSNEDDGYHTKAIEWAQRRLSADSIFGRFTTDGRRLFAIQESQARESLPAATPNGVGRQGSRFNKLCCYWLNTGTLAFELDGGSANSPNPFEGCVFLGCPLIVDNQMYVVVQRETTIRLLALDSESGSLIWSLDLGATMLPIADDLQRSHVACPVVWQDGLLLCSTSAGAVVAIDPLLKTMMWAYRYPATTIAVGDLQRSPNQYDAYNGYEPWWDFWREPFANVCQIKALAASGSQRNANEPQPHRAVYLFASPETDQLHAVRLPDGKPLWIVPRNEGILVAGVLRNVVIVVEGDAVRGHDIDSGRIVWRTPTAEIGGPGVIVDSSVMLPAQSGGTIVLDVQTGRLLATATSNEAPLGAMADAGSTWISFSRQSLSRLPQLSDALRRVEQELQNDPQSETLQIHAATLEMQMRDFTSARKRLEGLPSSTARMFCHQTLVELLRSMDPNQTNGERAALVRQLKDLSDDVGRQFVTAATIGSTSLATGDFAGAVNAALDGLAIEPDRIEGLISVDLVNVRRDRFLSGLIDEAYRRANPSEKTALDTLFNERLSDARKSRDRFAIQILAEQWRGLDWGRQVVAVDDEKALRKRTLQEAELQLLDAAGSSHRSVSQQALEKLAGRFDRAAAVRDATAVRKRILQERAWADFVDHPDAGRQIADELIRGESNLPQLKPLWNAVKPTLETRDERLFGLYSLIRLHAEPGSLAERLDICVDRNGNEVLFRGESFCQSGQDDEHDRKLKLPPTVSQYRGPVGYMLREAWGVGRIVVLLVGSELFAISPLDEKGDPNPTFLWSNPIELHGSPGDIRVVAGRSGLDEGRPIAIDQLNRPIGKVGPVRAGYFCYQKGRKLVAAETETGHTLWERLDLPADTEILGDDHHVFLWRDNSTLEILSAVDGRKIEDRAWGKPIETLMHQRGSLAWTLTRGQDLRLELYDLHDGRLIWSRSADRATKAAVLDPETLILVYPNGTLHLIAAQMGTDLCAPISVKTEPPSGILTWYDCEQWFVVLTRPLRDESPWKSLKPSETYRRPYLNGLLIGIDRRQRQVLWQRELEDEPIALDQSRVAPVLIQAWKRAQRGSVGITEGVLRLIDKRTGSVLVEKHRDDITPNFLLNPDLQQGILEVRLARELIRLDFSIPSSN